MSDIPPQLSEPPIGPNILFLFGAGLSVDAKLPTTEQLSARIIGVEDLHLHTSQEFFISKNPPEPTIYFPQSSKIPQVLALLAQFKAEVDAYESGRLSNYEDWYYLAHQVHSALTGDYDNPALFEYIHRLRNRLGVNSVVSPNQGFTDQLLIQTSELVMKYIQFMVVRELTRDKVDTDYLSWIDDAIDDPSVKVQGIFTLNHDLVLEKHFEEREAKGKSGCFTGFDLRFNPDYPGFLWDRDKVIDGDENDPRIFLGKLHGSIDWFDYEKRSSPTSSRRTPRIAFRRGEEPLPQGSRSLLLVGRHNKLYDYTNFLFEDLHYRFYKALRASNDLIICGYGLGDKGINQRIINWKQANPKRRLFIIKNTQASFDLTARLAMQMSMPQWEEDYALLHIKKWAKGVTWDDLKAAVPEKVQAHRSRQNQ